MGWTLGDWIPIVLMVWLGVAGGFGLGWLAHDRSIGRRYLRRARIYGITQEMPAIRPQVRRRRH